ncbi:MAG: hypothetical protein HN778_00155 [Prolixibacteraceae bacterium]|jgi:hypothetical protein|nr:hypothetical protein [Prolixibacteraceae bacterium]MBT6765538.1 hypothetical protein [Prolixibacteraceae bacterium]MBT6997384.1 hypothetical protein [Prolixibacteraceae bacterium]MBT7393222.1 hypothetical protein [Prolixibacteraceae bacterium]
MDISFSKIINQIKEIIINPKGFWREQKNKQESQFELLSGFLFPVLLIIAIVVFVGEFLWSADFYFAYAILKSVREIVLFALQYFIAVYLTNVLIETFGGIKNIAVSRKLVVFSLTPFLLVSVITGLFPYLYVIDILGIYGFYIFWIGAKELLAFPEEKQNRFILFAILVNFFVFGFLSIVLSRLLTTYF